MRVVRGEEATDKLKEDAARRAIEREQIECIELKKTVAK